MKRLAPVIFWLGLPLLLGWAGCAEVPVAKPYQAAPATDVGKVQAWSDAEQVAGTNTDRITVIGTGESMRPIYGENTVLVLSKIEYDNLKPGMQVAYLSQAGSRVVHVLLEKDTGGWRVQGLNNQHEDRERVTRYNLIGVVYASFATDEALK
ncbi:S24/S26 family peptidase [Rariglobus hedericola]|uniref:Peptidase S24/S26A/S26B/S26C domain-containing protein n=1 Tax=Rariglobus hedericola TaxID=2597822 RepID=A0A556QNQ1_9BACT|nr:S24/S26 family peptidase [Rariglobus hedericola]TSJ78263.1 hypothetical protein FPL22_02865 [Rariglobus hedericola]